MKIVFLSASSKISSWVGRTEQLCLLAYDLTQPCNCSLVGTASGLFLKLELPTKCLDFLEAEHTWATILYNISDMFFGLDTSSIVKLIFEKVE